MATQLHYHEPIEVADTASQSEPLRRIEAAHTEPLEQITKRPNLAFSNMTEGDFQSIFTTTKAPVPGRPVPFTYLFLKDAIKLPIILAIGALIQAIVFAIVPARYALVPLSLVLIRSIITTIIQSRSLKDNPFTADAVYGRVTAQLPSRSTGAFGSQPAAQSLVIFHLGVRMNHPLGPLCPGARKLGEHFQAMCEILGQRRDEFGMIGFSIWRANERETNNSMLMIAYFRNVQDLNRFAHDKVHRDGWDWYHAFAKKSGNKHISIFHETFVTQPGQYETIYVDCAPTLLGATNLRVKVDDEKQHQPEETWTRPLVSADHPALRSQSRRMGMTLGLEGKTDMY